MRLLTVLGVVIVLVIGALFLLAGRAHERPLTTIEKPVSLANLS